MPEPAELIVGDIALELVNRIRDAKKGVKDGDLHELGRRLGLYEALSLIVNRAKSFQIPLAALGLENIDPDDIYLE